MKKIISLILILVLFCVPAYAMTIANKEIETITNITITYYGDNDGNINILTYGQNKTYSLSNQTDSFTSTIPYNFSYETLSENITKACHDISQECSDMLPYLKDTVNLTEKYAEERSKRTESEAIANSSKELLTKKENELAITKNELDNARIFSTRFEVCSVNFLNCNDTLTKQIELTETAKAGRSSWALITGLFCFGIGYLIWGYFKKPREHDKDISEAKPPEERR